MLKTRLTLAGLLGACLALMFVGSIALLGAAPMIAPPIGATAFLCASAPTAPASSPRNVLYGHAIGLVMRLRRPRCCSARGISAPRWRAR
jgi:CBS-domain-containing membrane protein